MKFLTVVCFFVCGLSHRAYAQASSDCISRMAASEGGRTPTGRSTTIETAKLEPGNRMPGLPTREPHRFVVSVVVDTAGRADSTTIQLPAELDSFAVSEIRSVIPTWHFIPARLGPCPVKQVMRLTFSR